MHSLLSPSSAHRWLVCTPSARLGSGYPDDPSPAAEEGTRAHRWAEAQLKRMLHYWVSPEDEKAVPDNEEMRMYIAEYCLYIQGLIDGYPNSQVFLEVKLRMDEWIQDGYGTGDVVIVGEDTIHLIDLKYGRGVAVSAVDNAQLKLYALGCLHHFGLLSHFKNIKLTIYQPRLNSITTDEWGVDELLRWGERVVKPTAIAAYEGKGEYVVGSHCHWCKAAGTCTALARANTLVAQMEFSETTLTRKEIGEVLSSADRIRAWLTAVENQALRSMICGNQIEGWKVIRGRKNRIWKNKEEAIAHLLSLGYSEEDIYKPRVMHSVAQVEKMVEKEESKSLYKFIEKPEGALKLVKDTDEADTWSELAEDITAFKAADTET